MTPRYLALIIKDEAFINLDGEKLGRTDVWGNIRSTVTDT